MRSIICPVCGKSFIKDPYSVYKIKRRGKLYNLCSWSCYLELQRSIEADTDSKKNEDEQEVIQSADR